MNAVWRSQRGTASGAFAVVLGLGAVLHASLGQSETCVLSPHHAGVTFPVEKVDPDWVCRLQPIIANYTMANKVGPVRTPLPEALYHALLDRPPSAAVLVNRLGLAPYHATVRGSNQFGGSDGEGTEGLFQLT